MRAAPGGRTGARGRRNQQPALRSQPTPTTRSHTMPDFAPDDAASPRLFSRREMLGLLGAAAAGVSLIGASGAISLPSLGSSSAAMADGTATETVTQDKLGIQLWTCLAEYVADTPQTFAAIAAVGYKYV